jgi:hypothetical protein
MPWSPGYSTGLVPVKHVLSCAGCCHNHLVPQLAVRSVGCCQGSVHLDP